MHRITATPMRDPHSGQDYVLLRQVAVVRYNLLPNSRLLHEEIRTAQSLSDGDLLIARIFKHFREQHEEGSPSSKQGQHHAALEAARRWRSVIAIVSRKKKNDERGCVFRMRELLLATHTHTLSNLSVCEVCIPVIVVQGHAPHTSIHCFKLPKRARRRSSSFDISLRSHVAREARRIEPSIVAKALDFQDARWP